MGFNILKELAANGQSLMATMFIILLIFVLKTNDNREHRYLDQKDSMLDSLSKMTETMNSIKQCLQKDFTSINNNIKEIDRDVKDIKKELERRD